MAKSKTKFGWLGPDRSRYYWYPYTESKNFNIVAPTSTYRDSTGERLVFWDFVEKVTGSYLPNIPQQIGDCVSWGLRNVIDHLACFEIIRLGDNEQFQPSFPPYFYGISRVQIGGGKLGSSDGSLGIWAAEGVKKYGVLSSIADKVPDYSGSIAKSWGRSGPPKEFITEGKNHLVKEFARLHSYEELRDALCNGYPVSIASMRGFSMELKYDPNTGKHWFTGRDQWPHQMSIIGVDDNPRRPGIFRLNSWGPNAHGPQKDGPPGGGWQDADDIDKELKDSGVECICYSQFDGFPSQQPNYYWV